jgi:hypothetical protein
MTPKQIILPNNVRREIKQAFKVRLATVMQDEAMRRQIVELLVGAMEGAYHKLKKKEQGKLPLSGTQP